jgi:hypothetical protein
MLSAGAESMLIKTAVLDEIKAGRISLIFRRWKRASIKAGGTQLTQSGLLAIDSVDVVTEKQISEKDAKAAGYQSKDALLANLYHRDEDIYRIGVHWAGEDPRKVLRQQSDLSDAELDEIIGKLRNLDANSRRGNWTQTYLQMIHDQPNTHAAVLAEQVGLDIPHFKPWVRKLKALGLTESLRPGYRLSPRGEKVLQALRQKRAR